MQSSNRRTFLLICVAALGYFVDIYDLIIYNIVKYDSLNSLGYYGDKMKDIEWVIFNWQMVGMLLGGILWGIWGDKRGRVGVLFGSILIYSLANICNAWVVNVPQYCIVRFIAGVGLAGELGAGITLVSETMSKEKRGLGTMLIVSFGVLGTIAARFIGQHYGWQNAYLIGGGMGIILLLLRLGAFESKLFDNISKNKNISKGNFFLLFTKKRLLKKYLACIFLGLPIWYVVGVLMVLSNRFAEYRGVHNVNLLTI